MFLENCMAECKFSIKNTEYDIDEKYFEEIMVNLGMYLAERYTEVDWVSPLELMSEIAYINDLTIQQKMMIGFWIGRHFNDFEYEDLILQAMNKS